MAAGEHMKNTLETMDRAAPVAVAMGARAETSNEGGSFSPDQLKRAVDSTNADDPVYVRIAMALADLISAGGLKSKERLPSHRFLAQALGVNLTTVTKSFKYLKERGMVSAQVGRGTAVRGRELDHIAPTYERLQALPRLDLSVLKRHGAVYEELVGQSLKEVAAEPGNLAELAEYHQAAGTVAARETAMQWFASSGVPVDAEETAVTAGAQHALFLALSATMKAGDIVLVPSLAYQGVKMAAQILGLGLIPVDIDAGGLRPDELERHASNPRVKSIFVAPTLDNPTSTTLSLARRQEIVRIATRHSLTVIEDEVYRPLAREHLPSIRELYRNGTFHISSLAKVIAPGLRCGFMAFPQAFRPAIVRALRASMWMAEPLAVRLAGRLVETGRHRLIIEELRQQLTSRHQAALMQLGAHLRPGEPEGNCLWVNLPPHLPSAGFTDYLRGEGIGAAPADTFVTGDSRHSGVRLYKGSVASDADWLDAVATIRRCIESPRQGHDVV